MQKRVLIFIVAYNAHDHIRSVFDRLPKEVFNNPEFHILVIDDCSKDKTASTASSYVGSFNYKNVTILRNTINQGYGGNQKLGYRYAVENGFDQVILLHGDGQYAPELVLNFVESGRKHQADVVLGSRMLDKTKARQGGMPFYKWIGNQVLTGLQNLLVGSRLSEFHTGYRAYSTAFLKQVQFELNTNEFHFDTEILLQAFALNAKTVEFPIPTHYGDEVCHVNGMKYAKDVLIACIKYRSQKIGFFSAMQYRGLLQKDVSSSPYKRALHFVMGRWVQKNQKIIALAAEDVSDEEVNQQITESLSSLSGYDYILVLNRIEQLMNPEKFLVDARYAISGEKVPRFIFSCGNVAFVFVRILLSLGFFNYGERGVLRVKSKRLFTLSTFKKMLTETGYELKRATGIGLPLDLLFPNIFGKVLSSISNFFARLWPSMFAYQFVIEAEPQPHSYQLLSEAEKFYDSEKKPLSQMNC